MRVHAPTVIGQCTHSLNHANQPEINAIDRDLLPRAQWRMLAQALPWSITANFGAGALLAALLYWVLDIQGALLWFAAHSAVAAGRAVSLYMYGHKAVAGRRPSPARTVIIAGATLAGLVWGLGAMLLMPIDDPTAQVLFCFFAAGMTAGAAASFSAAPILFIGFATPFLALLVARLIYEPSQESRIMAAAVALFAICMYAVTRNAHRHVTYALNLWLANRRLHRNIVQARADELSARRQTSDMRRAKQQAESATEAKSRFLAMISHELRTPLNAVIGFSDMIKGEFFGPIGNAKYREYAEEIRGSGQFLLRLIDDILDISKIGDELHLGAVTLRSLCVAAAGETAPGDANGESRVIVDILPDTLQVNADHRLLRQAVQKLLENAVKFSPSDGRIRIEGRALPEGGVRLRIQDWGVGIPAHKLALVAEPFVQADDSYARRYDGIGLGLTLVRQIAELHGAQLQIESEENVGTTVDMIFPAVAVAATINPTRRAVG